MPYGCFMVTCLSFFLLITYFCNTGQEEGKNTRSAHCILALTQNLIPVKNSTVDSFFGWPEGLHAHSVCTCVLLNVFAVSRLHKVRRWRNMSGPIKAGIPQRTAIF